MIRSRILGKLMVIALLAAAVIAVVLLGFRHQTARLAPQSLFHTRLAATKNPTVANMRRDLSAVNNGDFVAPWWERVEGASEYAVFRAFSITGPWTQLFRVPLTNAVDFTAEARLRELCYRVEALNPQRVIIRSYEPVCVPKFAE